MIERILQITAEQRSAIERTAPLFFGAKVLRMLHHLHRGNLELLQHRRAGRLALHRRIAECAENGKILVVESGRDCDGVEYSGQTHLVGASVQEFDDLEREIGKWADGPFRLAVDKPSADEHIQYESTDLVLEAFEDGHPHSIVSRFA